MSLIITQLCTTVQGEGISIGKPVLLLRIGECNLSCSFCDTKWSKQIKSKDLNYFSKNKLCFPIIINSNDIEDFCKIINDKIKDYSIRRVMITGGEPFYNKIMLIKLINGLAKYTKIVDFEIETNGTLIDCDECDELNFGVNIQLNISPKLNHKFYTIEPKAESFNDILNIYKRNMKYIETFSEYYFKFVFSIEDNEKIDEFINMLNKNISISKSSILIMPLTPDYTKYDSEIDFLNSFRESSYFTLEYCIKHGYTFSPRMHIWIFNNFKNRNEFDDIKKEQEM